MPNLITIIPSSAKDMDDTFRRSIAHFVHHPPVAMTHERVGDVGAAATFQADEELPIPACVPRQVSFGSADVTSACDRVAAYGAEEMRNATFAGADRDVKASLGAALARRAVLERRLHVAIQSGAKCDVLERILRHDPGATSRSIPLVRTATLWHPIKRRNVHRHVRESYTFPLHLAIAKEMDTDALTLLIEADPSLLVVRDGPRCETPLLVLLRTTPTRLDVLDAMLLAQPFCASIKDEGGNTPLHMACQNGATVDVVKHLTILYPEAMAMTNHQGRLPLDLAQARARDSGDILQYLVVEGEGVSGADTSATPVDS